MSNADVAWARARAAAGSPQRAPAWQRALADAIELAIYPDAVAVFLCPLGNVLEAQAAVAPKELQQLGNRLVCDFLPRALRSGMASPAALIGAVTADAYERELMQPLRSDVLAPAGFDGMIGKFLRADCGSVVGWISIYTRLPVALRTSELQQPLKEVCQAFEVALRDCLTIAAALGARLPRLSPVLLSEREREVAQLAANGLSDLNIAQHLSISEGTVGRHLHSIFRKLGVGSRLELNDLALTCD